MLAIYDSQWGGPIPGPPFFSRASWIVPELSIGAARVQRHDKKMNKVTPHRYSILED